MLYLCSLIPRDESEESGFAVSTEIEKIDWMWHTFLLFTRDYADFCGPYFGSFIDHLPTDEDDEGGDGSRVDEDALRTRMERQFAIIYDELGEGTLTAWYDDCRYAARPDGPGGERFRCPVALAGRAADAADGNDPVPASTDPLAAPAGRPAAGGWPGPGEPGGPGGASDGSGEADSRKVADRRSVPFDRPFVPSPFDRPSFRPL